MKKSREKIACDIQKLLQRKDEEAQALKRLMDQLMAAEKRSAAIKNEGSKSKHAGKRDTHNKPN